MTVETDKSIFSAKNGRGNDCDKCNGDSSICVCFFVR